MNKTQHHPDPIQGAIMVLAIIGAIIFMIYIQRASLYSASIWVADRLFTGIYFIKHAASLDTASTIKTLVFINQKAAYMEPTITNLFNATTMIGSLFNYLAALMLVLWLLYSNIIYKYEKMFRRSLDYSSLKTELYKINPKLKVIQHIPNFAKDHEKGAFSRIETEWQFAVKNNIIDGTLSSTNETRDSFNEDDYLNAIHQQCGVLHPHPIVVDNKVQIHGAAKVILAIFCFYYEYEFKKTKQYINKSCKWFKAKRISSSEYQYRYDIPSDENKVLNNIIIQAFTNSTTLDEHDKIRRKNANEPLINGQIRKSIYIHNFTTTLLMSLFSSIKMVSTSDFKWLKAIDRHLYYALNNVGDPSPHSRCLGSAFIYEQELLLFKKRQPMIKKNLSVKLPLTTKDVISLFNWDIIINDFYFALESRQWVHHSKYLDVEDEDLINLSEKEFSYKNQVQLLLLANKENKRATAEIYFRKKDGSRFIDSMKLNSAGMLDEKDIAKFAIVVNSNYLHVNDYSALLRLCQTNQQYLPPIRVRGYDVLADACEVLGIKSFSWHNIILKYKSSYNTDEELENSLSASEYNWFIVDHVTNEIKNLYSV